MTNTEAAVSLLAQSKTVEHAAERYAYLASADHGQRAEHANLAALCRQDAEAMCLGVAALEAQFTDAEREAVIESLKYSVVDARHLPATHETRLALESALAKVTR